MQPVLSIIIATYNRLTELQTMLESLLPQVQGQPVEVVIVDDCSTDTTWEWLKVNLSAMPSIVCLRMEKNSGPGPARNLGLTAARGQYFAPIDSDFVVITGAIERLLLAIREEHRYHLLFFPCLQSPGMCRIDRLSGRSEITYESSVTGQLGELVAVADLAYLRKYRLSYPALRAGGEGILWAQILAGGPALFLDTPVVLYRTDVAGRICTLEYQMEHPKDLAAIADAEVTMIPRDARGTFKSARTRKSVAAGVYHLLAGNSKAGRQRLFDAACYGYLPAMLALIASFGGQRCFRMLFQFYRTRIQQAYL